MSKRSKLIFACVLLGVILLGQTWWKEKQFINHEFTKIVFLDVGQGDATLLRDSSGRTILIDAGPNEKILTGLEKHLPPWERTIDLLILTHLDADHIGGVTSVLRQYRINKIWWNGVVATTQKSRHLMNEIRKQNIPIDVVQTGESFALEDMSLDVIHPDTNLSGRYVKDKNAESVSLRVNCGEDIALFAGDAPIETEMDFLEDEDIGDITLLKVSHHGSKHSTSGKFLDAITPEYAVISSGKGNRYGHPALRVLIDLRKRGIKTFRTDELGDVIFVCNASTLQPLKR